MGEGRRVAFREFLTAEVRKVRFKVWIQPTKHPQYLTLDQAKKTEESGFRDFST